MTTTTTETDARTHWRGAATPEEIAHWDAVASRVADALGVDALARDRANAQPFTEKALLQESGLTTLLDPAEYGGGGAHWYTAFRAVRIIARQDASIAQLLGYHYVNESNIALVAPAADRERWFRATIEGQWVWGDSVNPVDPNLTLTEDGDGYRLDGFKRFSTGSGVGEALLVNAVVSGGARDGQLGYLVLPYGHPGVELVDDWDHLGQRLSASNTVRYNHARVDPAQVLGFGTAEPLQSFVTPAIQLLFGNLYLGVAEGALAQARELTVARPNSWFLSGVPTYADDPFVRRLYGELVAKTAAVEALADAVGREFDASIARGSAVTAADRADLAYRVAQLKVVANDTALDVANRVFEATGSSSTASKVGLDLHWRNVRTLSLHDPVDYKKLEVGARFLTGVVQPISLYT